MIAFPATISWYIVLSELNYSITQLNRLIWYFQEDEYYF